MLYPLGARRQVGGLGVGGAAGEQYETPAYTNAGGQGDRTGIMTVTGSGADLWGIIQTEDRFGFWVDGSRTNGAGGYPNNAIAVAGEWVSFDFGEKKLITEMKMYWNAAATPTGVWRCQGWNGTDWENVGGTFTLGTSMTQTIDISANTTGYTKYRWLGVSGVSDWNCYMWDEVEFKIGALIGGGGGEGVFF